MMIFSLPIEDYFATYKTAPQVPQANIETGEKSCKEFPALRVILSTGQSYKAHYDRNL